MNVFYIWKYILATYLREEAIYSLEEVSGIYDWKAVLREYFEKRFVANLKLEKMVTPFIIKR